MPRSWGPALGYVVTTTRWAALGAAAVAVTGAVLLVARWPAALWPLHGTALGILAGTAAVAVDERCALVVDVAPRPLWWRTALRAGGPVAMVLVWVLAHAARRQELPQHIDVLVLQGLVASVAGFAVATAGRAAGRCEPGRAVAAAVVPLATGLALARPFAATVPLFPVWPHEDWVRASRIWLATGAAAVVTVGVVLGRDARPGATRRGSPRS